MTTFETRPEVPAEALAPPVASLAIDAVRWPDIAALPHRRVRAAIARRLLRHAVKGLPMTVEVGSTGETWGAGGPGDPVMRLIRPDAFFERLGDSGPVGLGESYMAGDFAAGPMRRGNDGAGPIGDDSADDSADLVALMTVIADHAADLIPKPLQRLRHIGIRRQPSAEENTPTGSRRNISRHYDLSNDLFASFLDTTMTYSAALFSVAPGRAPGGTTWDDLESAQHAKIDRLLDACGVVAGTSVLEIGTGWGELALRAAGRGATVRSITLSEEQRDLAVKRVAAAGLSHLVSIELCDYRAVSGRYDAVVSVEMIEAVGAAYWPTYLATLDRVLAPGGTAAIQAITMPHDRMVATVANYTWIHKYIFPGGMIPSVEAVHAAAGATSLRVVDDLGFGLHYAETLRLWRERFEQRIDTLDDFGSAEVFRRMWTFYLAYCEAGFRARYLDVHQLTLRRQP